MSSSEDFSTAFMKLVKTEYQNSLKNLRSAPPGGSAVESTKARATEAMRRERTALEASKIDVHKLVESMSKKSIDGCVSLLEQLEVQSSQYESE